MAKNKRHIDLELKTKLGAHEVPVMENEWAAFESFRNKRETKRRRFIYLLAAALVFIAVSGMLVWKIQETKRNDQIENNLSERQPANSEGVTKRDQDQVSEEPINASDEKASPENPGSSISGSDNPVNSQDNTIPDNQEGIKLSQETGNQPGNTNEGKEEFVPKTFPPFASISVSPFVFHLPLPQLNWAEIPVMTAYKPSKENDSSKTLTGPKGKKFPPLNTPSLAFGLAYGFGNPSLTVGNNDSTQTHRQYEETLKEAKQNSRVFRLFLQYEYRLKFGLEFGAG
ncbi:MAG: hypothetical protein ACYC1Q_04260, partial [Bacteroidia bacterium]